jgi:HAD superfamily hydrolase (TIGR01509 family)
MMGSAAVRAVIFDMDGVISDTQRLHAEGESRMLVDWGVHLSADEITERFAGLADHDFFPAALGRALPAEEMAALVERKWANLARDAPGRIVPMEGSVELIRLLGARGLPIAVASSSPMTFIHQVLDELGVADAFAARATGEEVPAGKPAPDVFLLAAQRLGVEPSACLVIEDAPAGVAAARAAGMRCIGLAPDGGSRLDAATVVVRSLREVVNDPERFLGGADQE